MKNMNKKFIAKKQQVAAYVEEHKLELAFLAGVVASTVVSIGTAAQVNKRTWDRADEKVKKQNPEAMPMRLRDGSFGYVLPKNEREAL